MLVSNGVSSRRKLGLSNSTESNLTKVSSRRLTQQQQQPSGKSTSKLNSKPTGKNLNEQLKLKKSLTKSKKSVSKLSAKGLSSLNKSGPKSSTKKHKLKERRHHHHHHHRHTNHEDDEDDENDENDPDDFRYREDDDLGNMDDIDCMMSGPDLDTPMFHMTQEEFERADKHLETRLDELKRKLDALRNVDLLSPTRADNPILSDFCFELDRLENEARSNMNSIKYWFDKEMNDIEEQFKIEYKRSIHDYQERRKDLKESLKNEHEDARKQIETDKQTLDINSDIIEVKPAPTRNLRRRCAIGPGGAGSNSAITSGSNSLFSSQVFIDYTLEAVDSNQLNAVVAGGSVPVQAGASASFVSSNQSPLLTGNLSTVVESITTGANSNGLFFTSLIQQQVTNGPSGILNGSIIQYGGDRKQRKVGPLAITISEDEINEDHRSLLRSLRNPHSASPKVQQANSSMMDY